MLYSSPLILFSSLFPYFTPPILIFSFENRPTPFPGGCHTRRLNQTRLQFILRSSTFHLIGECVLLLLRLVFFHTNQEIGLGKRL